MINLFDAFFYKITPSINTLWIKTISNLADPKTHLFFWGILSCYFLYRRKMDVINSKPFYFFLQTGIIMFICGILKISVGRARPFLLDENIIGFFHLSTKHAYLSFPSSHMAISGAFAFSLRRFYKINVIIYAFPLIIAFTRLSLMEHFATDIFAGLFIGMTLAYYLVRHLDSAIKKISKIMT